MGKITRFLERKLRQYNQREENRPVEDKLRKFFEKYVELQMLMGYYPIKDDEQGFKDFVARLYKDFNGALASDGALNAAWEYMKNNWGDI